MNEVAIPFNEQGIEKALIDAHGDIFVAAQLLGHVTAVRVDRAIKASERLQTVFSEVKRVESDYDKLSHQQFENEVARRMSLYRAVGLEALHDLADMKIGDNSAMAQVKLAAAARLTSGIGERVESSDIQQALIDLNAAYHQHAPRIKITRQTSIEIGAPETVIDGTATQVE